MAALAALVAVLATMFAGALLVDGWRTRRLRAWAAAQGFVPVDRRGDGGALLAHATRFSTRVRSFGLAFQRPADDAELWIAEHRARTTTTRAEKWHTLVVVRLPGDSGSDDGLSSIAGWPHGGDVDVSGDVARWRRVGLLWPWNADRTLARGRELAALSADQRLGTTQK